MRHQRDEEFLQTYRIIVAEGLFPFPLLWGKVYCFPGVYVVPYPGPTLSVFDR
jgi:hypothetical protein